MKLAWIVAAGVHRLVLDAPPAFTNVGLGSVPGLPRLYPTVTLAYRLLDLAQLTPCFTYMRDHTLSPEIYLWELESPDPELIVAFRIPMPGRQMLKKLIGPLMANLTTDAAEDVPFEFLVQSAGNASNTWAHAFLETFQETKCAALLISETQEYHEESVMPTAGFVVDKVYTHPPPPLLS
ncbi:MAG TPA: hypothetical protein VEB18_01475 [Candidatus Paceibacterota bacterium]|nr:hypothetical protein [Candidatus Paceibacterota bacterium]